MLIWFSFGLMFSKMQCCTIKYVQQNLFLQLFKLIQSVITKKCEKSSSESVDVPIPCKLVCKYRSTQSRLTVKHQFWRNAPSTCPLHTKKKEYLFQKVWQSFIDMLQFIKLAKPIDRHDAIKLQKQFLNRWNYLWWRSPLKGILLFILLSMLSWHRYFIYDDGSLMPDKWVNYPSDVV